MHDGVILYAKEDREAVLEFKRFLESKPKVGDVNIALYEDFAPEIQNLFRTINVVFDRCRYVFVYVTENFQQSCLDRYQQEIALIDSIENPEKNERIIPVNGCNMHAGKLLQELCPLVPLDYFGRARDEHFVQSVETLIRYGRSHYLANQVS